MTEKTKHGRSLYRLVRFSDSGFKRPINRKSLRSVLISIWVSGATAWFAHAVNSVFIFNAVLRANERTTNVSLKENFSVYGVEVIKDDFAICFGGTTRN